MKKYLALLLAVAMLCMAMVGCGPSNQGSVDGTGEKGPDGREIAKEQVYKSIYSSEVDTLNYLVTGSTNNLVIGANTIDALVENDQYGTIVACGAESVPTPVNNADGTQTWTFKLKQGQYWYDHTGAQKDEVTAEDYVAAMQYVCNAENDASNFYLVRGWLVNAKAYYDYTSALMAAVEKGTEVTTGDAKDEYVIDANGKLEEIVYNDDGTISYVAVEEVKFETVGIKAVDKYTVEYTLESPRPYFLTVMGFGTYWPAAKAMLEQHGTQYGTDNEKMWYNGAYILSTFESGAKRVYTKNEKNWDADNVHIVEINQTCVDDSSNSLNLYLNGEISGVGVTSDQLKDPSIKEKVTPTRVTADYSYFYCMNFVPRVAEVGRQSGITQADDDAWAACVANADFRKAIFHAINRQPLYSIGYPDNYELLIKNTISPKGQYIHNGKDYTSYAGLANIVDKDSYDKDAAKSYMDKAVAVLKTQGVTFPIKCVLSYNSSSDSWTDESTMLKQQLETLFGKDVIEVVLQGVGTDFLNACRRNGNYHLEKCNWGADYSDPETWTDPFTISNSYNFSNKSEDPAIKAISDQYEALVAAARAETGDMDKRFEAFAKAEAFYIENAMVVPYGITGGSYQITHMNTFEGQYAGYGQAVNRYKGQWLYTTPMTQEQFDDQLAKWNAKLGQ